MSIKSREIVNTYNLLTTILNTSSNSIEYNILKLLLNDDEKIALKILKVGKAQDTYKQNKLSGTIRPKTASVIKNNTTPDVITCITDLSVGEYAILSYYDTDQPELHLEENKEVPQEEANNQSIETPNT